MASVKKMFKDIKGEHVLGIIGLVFLVYALYQYSQNKNLFQAGMTSYSTSNTNSNSSAQNVSGNQVNGYSQDSAAAPVSQIENTATKQASNPLDLLPSSGDAWDSANPTPSLQGAQLLNPSQVVGINTQGSSLRNANLQLRSEPPNPRMNTNCPWNISTIESDSLRKPLEIGAPSVA